MSRTNLTAAELNSLFPECRQCGACCKNYRKVLLQPEEVEFIKKMGGYVGIEVRLNDLRKNSLDEAIEKENEKHNVYMIHPDSNGCIFLEKKNGKYRCKIYNYRPKTCRGFRCNLADGSLGDIFFKDPIHLLGMDRFGMKLK